MVVVALTFLSATTLLGLKGRPRSLRQPVRMSAPQLCAGHYFGSHCEIAGPVDESCRPSPVPDNATQRLPDFVYIRTIQKAQSCLGVCDHSGDRLHHFAVDVRQFRVWFAVLQLPLARLSPRCDCVQSRSSPISTLPAERPPKWAFAIVTGEYSRHCGVKFQFRKTATRIRVP
jgi:hypothetical protein